MISVVLRWQTGKVNICTKFHSTVLILISVAENARLCNDKLHAPCSARKRGLHIYVWPCDFICCVCVHWFNYILIDAYVSMELRSAYIARCWIIKQLRARVRGLNTSWKCLNTLIHYCLARNMCLLLCACASERSYVRWRVGSIYKYSFYFPVICG